MSLTITQYQIDAFAQNVFEGNPAAVCPAETARTAISNIARTPEDY